MASEGEREDRRVIAEFLVRAILPIAISGALSYFARRMPWIFEIYLALLILAIVFSSISYFKDAFERRTRVENAREYTIWISLEAMGALAGVSFLIYYFVALTTNSPLPS